MEACFHALGTVDVSQQRLYRFSRGVIRAGHLFRILYGMAS